MARRKRHEEHANHERWLVSYADFITLLFAFFVVMFASSQTDKAKAEQVAGAVRAAFENGGIASAVREVIGGTVDEVGKGNALMRGPGGAQSVPKNAPDPAVAELLPSLTILNRELQREITEGKIQVSLQPRGLVVSLAQAAFFPSGEDTIDPSTYPSMEKVARVMRTLPNSVRLEGHTDSIPISTGRFHSNWELSAARAIAMLDLLTKRFQIGREKLAIAGYADTVPVGSNQTEEGRARNRRVDIVILSQRGILPEPQKK